jgi:predicted ATPase
MADLGIPDGVRRVVTHRVSRLAAPTSNVLHAAAAFTGGVAFPVLQAVTELPEDVLLDSIDEALRAGLIHVLAGPAVAYDFAHAIVRHTLYAELNPDRRARPHRRIATALEQMYGDHAADHVAELAAQYHASASLPDAPRGVPYCLSAAQQARASYAHERAVTFLRMARDLAQAEAPDARASIWSALAIAEAEALMLDAAQRSIEEALAALAQAGAEAIERAGFLVEVARALKEGGASHAVWEHLVERGLALVGDRRDLAWARLMLLRDHLEPVSSASITAGQWLGYDPRAVAIARHCAASRAGS